MAGGRVHAKDIEGLRKAGSKDGKATKDLLGNVYDDYDNYYCDLL